MNSPATPLPLVATGFEHYMVTDESRAHPMVSYLEVGLAGPVDVERLADTLPAAYARHPLMATRLAPRWARSPLWITSDPAPLRIITEPARDLPPLEDEYLDLTQSSGCCPSLLLGEGGATLYLFVHHACADALGMLAFLVDWLNAYGRAGGRGSIPPELPPPDWDLLRQRGSLKGIRSPYSFRERLHKIRTILHKSRPRPLTLPAREPEPATPPAHCVRTLTARQFQSVQAFARSASMTVNDLLTWAMLRTVLRWQERHGAVDPDDLYRLIVPISRRTAEDRNLCAVNKIAYKFVARKASEIRQAGLLGSVHVEMEFVRQHRMRIVNMLKMIDRLQRLRLTRRLLPPTRCFATAVLSNLGDVSRLFSDRLPTENGQWIAGDLRVTSLACAPPRRPLTHNTVVAIGYGQTLTLASRGDGRGLGHADTKAFLDLLGDDLLSVCRQDVPV